MIIWAGTSNKDVGMIVEHYPTVIFPERDQEIQHVPGRNGDIILPTGSFQNYEQPYSVFLDSKKYGGLEQVMPKLSGWLLGHEGYQRLEDSYFPDFYRMAYYAGGSEFLSIFNEYGKGTLTFVCAPERYYKSGEKKIMIENGQVLLNPSSFDAFPMMRVRGNGTNAKLKFTHYHTEINEAGEKVEIPEEKTLTITKLETIIGIDVKLHKAYRRTTNLNDLIKGKYEDFKLGRKTKISWSGGITGVELYPRWWTI